MARILWSAPFHISCMYPAVPIALELQARGHEIVVQTIPGAEPFIRDLGFGFRANEAFPVDDFGDPEAAPWLPEEQFTSSRFWSWWHARLDAQVSDTTTLLDAEIFDLVFGGACTMLCGAGWAAERAGVRWASYVHFCMDEVAYDIGFVRRWNRLRSRHRLGAEGRHRREGFWYPVSSELTLLVGIGPLQYHGGPLPAYVHQIPPIDWDPPTHSAPPDWLEELGRCRPAILVSLSHFWRESASMVACLADGLGEENVDVVITAPSSHDLRGLPPNVRVAGYVPHSLLLPKVAVVLCTAGFGTTTRATLAGVPVVAVPQGGDGREVATAISRTGVGIVLDQSALSPSTLRRVVMGAIGDPDVLAASRQLREAVGGADPVQEGADLVDDLLSGAE